MNTVSAWDLDILAVFRSGDLSFFPLHWLPTRSWCTQNLSQETILLRNSGSSLLTHLQKSTQISALFSVCSLFKIFGTILAHTFLLFKIVVMFPYPYALILLLFRWPDDDRFVPESSLFIISKLCAHSLPSILLFLLKYRVSQKDVPNFNNLLHEFNITQVNKISIDWKENPPNIFQAHYRCSTYAPPATRHTSSR
jgi:hypothetical protein